MKAEKSPSSTSLERAFTILELLDRARRRWNISEISRKLNFPKSTTHILIVTLLRLGYLNYDAKTKTYGVSLKLGALGRNAFKDLPLSTAALPYMKELATGLRVTVHLALLEKRQAVYIQKVEGPENLHFDTYIGKRINLHCTGVGKLLLAYSTHEFQQEVIDRVTFLRHTPKTIFSAPLLIKDLKSIRKRGWAMDDEEEELNVRCLAVPVLDEKSETVAALGISSTVDMLEEGIIQRTVNSMRETARRIGGAI